MTASNNETVYWKTTVLQPYLVSIKNSNQGISIQLNSI
jgi:hypothetical protein